MVEEKNGLDALQSLVPSQATDLMGQWDWIDIGWKMEDAPDPTVYGKNLINQQMDSAGIH